MSLSNPETSIKPIYLNLYLNKLIKTSEFLCQDCIHALIFYHREDFLDFWNIEWLGEIC